MDASARTDAAATATADVDADRRSKPGRSPTDDDSPAPDGSAPRESAADGSARPTVAISAATDDSADPTIAATVFATAVWLDAVIGRR